MITGVTVWIASLVQSQLRKLTSLTILAVVWGANGPQKRKSIRTVSCHLVSNVTPEGGTFPSHKSCGKLTNIIADTRCMFVMIEQVLQDNFNPAFGKLNEADYMDDYYKNTVF